MLSVLSEGRGSAAVFFKQWVPYEIDVLHDGVVCGC